MHILVAEDEQYIASFLKRGLEKESIGVDIASDGDRALHMAYMNNYDVILLDIGLPKLSGLEVCKKLREHGKDCPIIIISSRGETDDKIRGLDSGADDYLPKPFSLQELMARIRAVSRRNESLQKPNLELDDILIDYNKLKLTRAGKTIDLSPKEFRLLEYLVRNKGKVLNRCEILENVWGSGEMMFSKAVDVHVSNLRNKLNSGFPKKLIKTVRGTGYIYE